MLIKPFSEVHELGYTFYPTVHPDLPGHSKMKIVLCAVPSQQHFDPEKVRCPVATDNRLGFLFVTHPWHGSGHYRVCAGRVIICDRIGKEVEAFTLGAELDIESAGDRTVCLLTSSAPILDLTLPDSLSINLAEEIAILIAERRAVWADHPAGYEERLTRADPAKLFIACLLALSQKFSHYPYSVDDPTHHLIGFLHSDICVGTDGLISPLINHPTLTDLL